MTCGGARLEQGLELQPKTDPASPTGGGVRLLYVERNRCHIKAATGDADIQTGLIQVLDDLRADALQPAG